MMTEEIVDDEAVAISLCYYKDYSDGCIVSMSHSMQSNVTGTYFVYFL